MSEYNTPETCPKCAGSAYKLPSLFAVDKLSLTTGSGVSTEEYNPGLGCYTKSTKDAERIAAKRGLEPIGSEPVEKLHKRYEKQREETRADRWRQADRVMVYE